MSSLDWAIVAAYLLLALAMGAWVSRRASTSLLSYFVAGRSLPWWLAGTSMVATTFAADTPLWVAGVVATKGIAGNWFWWSFAIAHVLGAVYLARLWRRSEVTTDAGVIERRYSGRPAAALRAFKAFFFAVPINCITMGWVILAMRKIMGVFIDWPAILGPDRWDALAGAWPSWVAVDPSTGLSVLLAMALAVTYSTLGGLRGVVLTDLVQFLLAMTGAVAVAWLGVEAVGGLDALPARLQASTGDASGILALVPAADSTWMPLRLFGLYLLVLWWAQKYSDSGGYLAQRMSACRNDADAAKATLLFTALHYVARSWPWILAGLAAVVLYPGAEDPEASYPRLMLDVLPPGLLGLAVTSLLAAFMSTIDTHVNWGASYLVTDLYARFVRRDASQAHYVRVSRLAVVLVALVAAAITTQMDSIDAAWKFFSALGSGLGLVSLARWLWWRVNAWSEIAALVATTVVTAVLTWLVPAITGEAVPFFWNILLTMGVSTAVWVPVTFLTPPTEPAVLDAFYRQVRPVGAWGPVRRRCESGAAEGSLPVLAAWLSGIAFVYLLLFGLGKVLLGAPVVGVLLLAGGAACGVLAYRFMLR